MGHFCHAYMSLLSLSGAFSYTLILFCFVEVDYTTNFVLCQEGEFYTLIGWLCLVESTPLGEMRSRRLLVFFVVGTFFVNVYVDFGFCELVVGGVGFVFYNVLLVVFRGKWCLPG